MSKYNMSLEDIIAMNKSKNKVENNQKIFKPINVEPIRIKINNVEPINAEPINVEPINVEPIRVEINNVESINAESIRVEINNVDINSPINNCSSKKELTTKKRRYALDKQSSNMQKFALCKFGKNCKYSHPEVVQLSDVDMYTQKNKYIYIPPTRLNQSNVVNAPSINAPSIYVPSIYVPSVFVPSLRVPSLYVQLHSLCIADLIKIIKNRIQVVEYGDEMKFLYNNKVYDRLDILALDLQ
jgi:hypothetical protein